MKCIYIFFLLSLGSCECQTSHVTKFPLELYGKEKRPLKWKESRRLRFRESTLPPDNFNYNGI